MREHETGNEKVFYAVQFIQLPFEGIDDYVCVPNSWIKLHRSTDRKVLAAYPKDEDPFDTRDRAKRREKYGNDWQFYFAIIKYKSDTYEDVEFWIATRNDYGPCEENQLNTKDTQPEPVLDRKLRSSIHALSDSIKNKPQLTVKPYDNPQKPMLKIPSKRSIQPKLTGDLSRSPRLLSNKRLKLVEADELTIINTASKGKTSTGQKTLPKVLHENNPALSMSILDVVESNNVDGDQAVQSERPSSSQTPPNNPKPSSQPDSVNERPAWPVYQENLPLLPRPQETSTAKSNGIEDNSQKTELHRILTAPTTVSKISVVNQISTSVVNQISQLHQHTQSQFQPVRDNLYSDPQPRKVDVGRSAEWSHNNQRPRSQCLMTTLSTSHRVPNLIRISSQLFEPRSRKPSSSVIKNAGVKKSCQENIPRYISAGTRHSSNPSMRSSFSLCTQSGHNHLQVSREPVNHARYHFGRNDIEQRLLLQGTINNTSATQNLSNLAYQSRFRVEDAHQRQHLPTKEDYLQQIPRIQGLLRKPDIVPTTDQRGYIQRSMMNGGFIRHNQANSISQHSQFLPGPENQSVPIDKDHMQQVLRPRLLWGATERTHTVHNVNFQNVEINIPFTAQTSSYVPNQSHNNVELLQQRQNPPNYQDRQRDLTTSKVQFDPSFNSKSNSQRPEPQITLPSALLNISNPTRQSNGHENYLLRDPRIQVRLNQSSTEHHSNLTTVPQNITVEPITMQNLKGQTTSSDPSHETQFTLEPDIDAYQDPRTKKLMVDQSTATDFNMDHDHCNETVISPVIEISPRVVNSECQTDNLLEKSLSPCQEIASDHKAITDNEIVSDQEEISDQAEVSDNEISTDVPPLDMNDTVICTEESPPQNNTEERPTIVQNCTPENQQVHPRVFAEQKMLNIFATLFTQMGAHMSYTCEMFHNIHTSVLKSAKTYQLLLETVESFNSMGNVQIDVSPSNIVAAEVPQLTEERPAGESERANSVNEEENANNGSGDVPEKTRPRHTFVLPPEYDPNDSKWTLKYKKKMPGLVELMSRSGIYVRSSELKRCKKESKDRKMLARLLLTEIFNKSALSVCSLTGGKAKAFNNVDIDVRPGLDAHARMVLLAYVEEYGLKRKWHTSDSQSIISSIRTKIQEIRAKYGKSVTCLPITSVL